MGFKFIVFIIYTILAAFLVFKEIKRSNKSNVLWRILASCLMVISFALLVIPINYQTKKEQSVSELNIITAGTDLATITKIQGDKYDIDSNLFSSNKNIEINHIEDLTYYLQENKDVKKINIYGYGLGELELKKLQNYQVSFHPAALPQGFISTSWQNKIKKTEKLNVQGIYNNTNNQAVALKLFGLGGTLDSTIVKGNTKSKFSFQTHPKQKGKAIYQLIALEGADTLSVAPIPFKVLPKQPIQVLILASFPDFEYKFLKNWLYEKQYQVVFRSQISKDKHSSDFLNTKTIDVSRINQALLNKMDVVLIDEDELGSLNTIERNAINLAVNNGMGLIIRLTNVSASKNIARYGRYEIPTSAAKAIKINDVIGSTMFKELPFPQSLFLETNSTEQALFNSSTGKTVVNIQLNGMGKTILSTLSSTYQWALTGNKADYASFWTSLFSKVSRKAIETQSVEITPSFLNIGNKARVITNILENKFPILAFNEVTLNPKQNMEIPFRWDADFWPTVAGWNTVTINNKNEDLFVYNKFDWVALKNTNKLKLNSMFAAQRLDENIDIKLVEQTENKEISKWWFFIIFLLSISYLWYEQRFLAN